MANYQSPCKSYATVTPYWADDDDDLMEDNEDEEEEEEEIKYAESGRLHINLLDSEAKETFEESADHASLHDVKQRDHKTSHAADTYSVAVGAVKALEHSQQQEEDDWQPKNLTLMMGN
jgi:hypothetical protein